MNSAKSPIIRLRHIRHDVEAMIASTVGMTDHEIVESHVHRRALERSVEIVSEAAKALPDWLRATEPEIPWRDIIGIGNLLRHEYYRIDDTTMLNVLHAHLPKLLGAVNRMERRLQDFAT